MSPSIASLELPPFRPRFPWWGPALQTIAGIIVPSTRTLEPHSSERLRFPMADRTGDVLLGMLDRPAEPDPARPLIILIHGLTGSEDSLYIVRSARHLLDRGYPVLRFNMRGAGPSRPCCGEHFHGGRTADFRRALAQIPEEMSRNGIVAIGYSLGGTMLLKYLGEEGSFAPLRAAASICSPIDLARNCQHMMRTRNWLYHAYILSELKAEALAPCARNTPEEETLLRGLHNIWEYDELFIAPRYGFRDAADYHELCAPLRYMPEIRVPTMVLAAGDDPWIPSEHYREVKWSDNPWLLPVMSEMGGHVGFHGEESPQPWCDLAAEKFLEQVVSIEA